MLGEGPPRLVRVALIAVAAVTAVAIVVLWPGDDRPALPSGLGNDSELAEVESVTETACAGPSGSCADAAIRLESGPDEGTDATIRLGEFVADPELDVGDRIRVVDNQGTYLFVDFERRGPLIWLALAFAALVVLFGRLRGALSLVGLGLSLLIVLGFVVPAILSGEEPFAVAVAGALAVMLVTIPLAHGLGGKSLAAMLGTCVALLLTAGLALAFTKLTTLTGYSFDEALALQSAGIEISFQGLLLAGVVIGALGVLDDVTVSQASTVFALRASDPDSSFGTLFRRALDVGRDHVSATVNTLVLAYVGAALPVLIVFGSSDVSLANAVNLEIVAREVVAMLVGSIGLIAAVPVTTALAAWLAGSTPEADLAPSPTRPPALTPRTAAGRDHLAVAGCISSGLRRPAGLRFARGRQARGGAPGADHAGRRLHRHLHDGRQAVRRNPGGQPRGEHPGDGVARPGGVHHLGLDPRHRLNPAGGDRQRPALAERDHDRVGPVRAHRRPRRPRSAPSPPSRIASPSLHFTTVAVATSSRITRSISSWSAHRRGLTFGSQSTCQPRSRASRAASIVTVRSASPSSVSLPTTRTPGSPDRAGSRSSPAWAAGRSSSP